MHLICQVAKLFEVLCFFNERFAGLYAHNTLVIGARDSGIGFPDQSGAFQDPLLKIQAYPCQNRQDR